MTATFTFDDSTPFEGFQVAIRLGPEVSKNSIVGECFKRLDNVLETLRMSKLRTTLQNLNLCVVGSLPIEDGKEYKIVGVQL